MKQPNQLWIAIPLHQVIKETMMKSLFKLDSKEGIFLLPIDENIKQ